VADFDLLGREMVLVVVGRREEAVGVLAFLVVSDK